MVARDWRGSKDIYREWSKMGVEVLLGGVYGKAAEQGEKSSHLDASLASWATGAVTCAGGRQGAARPELEGCGLGPPLASQGRRISTVFTRKVLNMSR